MFIRDVRSDTKHPDQDITFAGLRGCEELQREVGEVVDASRDEIQENVGSKQELPPPQFREYAQERRPDSPWRLNAATHLYDYGWFAKLPQFSLENIVEAGLSDDLKELQQLCERAQEHEGVASLPNRACRS